MSPEQYSEPALQAGGHDELSPGHAAGVTIYRLVWHDFRRAWRVLVAFEVLVKLLETWLFVPVVAAMLSTALSRAGHVAVSNRDILDFLRSPYGLLYAILLGTGALAALLLEQAGIMGLVRWSDGSDPRPLSGSVGAFVRVLFRVLGLGVAKTAVLALAGAAFVLPAAATWGIFLSAHDINYYLTERPPAFWLAGGIGAVLLLGSLGLGIWLYVRWSIALPVLLFENKPVRAALRASRERVRGAGWRVVVLLLGWPLVVLLLGATLEAGFRALAAAALDRAGERPTALLILLLIAQGGLLAAVSLCAILGQALLTRRLYLLRSEPLDSSRRENPQPTGDQERPTARGPRLLAYLSIAIVLLAPLVHRLNQPPVAASLPVVRVTAHRGHSRAAPENTLSAIRKAIDSGADYAEVDVQQTADGEVVLLHDRDLKRVARVARRIAELPYEEVRNLDVGSWFDPSFAGERVPLLAEAIDLCRGRIRMNIELKLYGPNRTLAPAVARLVREKAFESDCLVTSFDYAALLEMKRHNPRLRTGLTVSYALGDVSRLDVEALSVRADWLSESLLRAAHRAAKEVHVWTVNDPRRMARLMQRGVDNIITDDPDLLLHVRGEWQARTEHEQLLLASRVLLGLDPWRVGARDSAIDP